jgi:hypothetical protein
MDVRFRSRPAVRAPGAAGLGASAEGFVDDGLDGARASSAFGAAAKAAIDLFGTARQAIRGADSAADIMVGEDVAGTDDHTNGEPIGGGCEGPSIFKTDAGCKRKKRLFK